MERKVKSLRIKWNGRTPRTFSLPIPFISYSEKVGEVLCDPIGDFPPEDGQRLLDMEGSLAELVETIYEGEAPTEATGPAITVANDPCACGCGKPVSKQGNRFILGHSSKFPKTPSQEEPKEQSVTV